MTYRLQLKFSTLLPPDNREKLQISKLYFVVISFLPDFVTLTMLCTFQKRKLIAEQCVTARGRKLSRSNAVCRLQTVAMNYGIVPLVAYT